jgi:1,4-dihydroxy-2-naphthoate octaprenyltransferase
MLAAWLQAARPPAQVNLAVPLVFGQAMAFGVHGRFAVGWLAVSAVFSALVQLEIVFTNDVGDRETDRDNTTFTRFSGGSRVLPAGVLSAEALTRAARLALAGLVGLALALLPARPGLLALVAATALLVWSYDRPPLRLSYRGGGEVVQGLGTGVVLPLAGFYLQAGTLAGFAASALLPMFLLGVAGHILTALPDVPSDRAHAKRTLPVRRGSRVARRRALALLAAAAALGGAAVPGTPAPAVALLAAPALLLAASALPLRADAARRDECARFVLRVAGAAHLLALAWALAWVMQAVP